MFPKQTITLGRTDSMSVLFPALSHCLTQFLIPMEYKREKELDRKRNVRSGDWGPYIFLPSGQERNPGNKCPSRSCLNVSTAKPEPGT